MAKKRGKQKKDIEEDGDSGSWKKMNWGPLQPMIDNENFKKFRRAAFRFCVYGAIMCFLEICFYNVTRMGREIPLIEWLFKFKWLVKVPGVDLNVMWDAPILSLYGQASLWMFFVYGFIVLFGVEKVHKHLIRKHNWFIRGVAYMFTILILECLTGWVLYGLLFLATGNEYSIWYYGGPLSIVKYTSWAIAPLWFIAGLMSENFFHIIDKLSRLKLAKDVLSG